jgi:hypothetical protein
VEVCKSGWHLVTLEGIPEWVKIGALYEAEGRGEPQSDDGRKFCFAQARLLRKVGDLTTPVLVFWAADCAEHVLPVFETKYPEDDRPRKAIEAARAWVANPTDANRNASTYAAYNAHDAAYAANAAYNAAAYNAAAYNAFDAAYDVAYDAAYAAAYAANAATYAAYAAYNAHTHAAAYATHAAHDAANAAYAAWDAARDAAWDAARDAAWDAEKAWQGRRLIELLEKP